LTIGRNDKNKYTTSIRAPRPAIGTKKNEMIEVKGILKAKDKIRVSKCEFEQ
jgi:hypothetical protein